MSQSSIPAHVRVHIVLWRAALVMGALGIVGFFLSFEQVAGPARWSAGVHRDIPWFAYGSILCWAGGLALGWYARHMLRVAVRKREAELAAAAKVDLSDE